MVPEERHLVNQLRLDMINGMSRREIVNTYFKWTEEISDSYNLCYTNAACEHVSAMYRKTCKKPSEYIPGEQLIFKGHNKGKKKTMLQHNCTYTIEKNNGNTLTLRSKGDEVEDVDMSFIRVGGVARTGFHGNGRSALPRTPGCDGAARRRPGRRSARTVELTMRCIRHDARHWSRRAASDTMRGIGRDARHWSRRAASDTMRCIGRDALHAWHRSRCVASAVMRCIRHDALHRPRCVASDTMCASSVAMRCTRHDALHLSRRVDVATNTTRGHHSRATRAGQAGSAPRSLHSYLKVEERRGEND